MKKMSIEEFRGLGFLLEANRQFFHPLGLALAIVDEKSEGNKLEIWDGRDDPEGFFFGGFNDSDIERAAQVQALRDAKATVRRQRRGYIVQPLIEEAP